MLPSPGCCKTARSCLRPVVTARPLQCAAARLRASAACRFFVRTLERLRPHGAHACVPRRARRGPTSVYGPTYTEAHPSRRLWPNRTAARRGTRHLARLGSSTRTARHGSPATRADTHVARPGPRTPGARACARCRAARHGFTRPASAPGPGRHCFRGPRDMLRHCPRDTHVCSAPLRWSNTHHHGFFYDYSLQHKDPFQKTHI